MTVSQLIEKLQKFDGDLEVGRAGYFGDIIEGLKYNPHEPDRD